MPKVRVHWHSRKKEWSVKIGKEKAQYFNSLYVSDATFVVQPAGLARARKTGQRNVHAFVNGTLGSRVACNPDWGVNVTFNPFVNSTFVSDDGEPMLSADLVSLNPDGSVMAWNFPPLVKAKP